MVGFSKSSSETTRRDAPVVQVPGQARNRGEQMANRFRQFMEEAPTSSKIYEQTERGEFLPSEDVRYTKTVEMPARETLQTNLENLGERRARLGGSLAKPASAAAAERGEQVLGDELARVGSKAHQMEKQRMFKAPMQQRKFEQMPFKTGAALTKLLNSLRRGYGPTPSVSSEDYGFGLSILSGGGSSGGSSGDSSGGGN